MINEYENLRPNLAKKIYLTVCLLNRLRTSVRAGLISRLHEITFADFRDSFFRPLEHVVEVEENFSTKECYYTARHPEIAQIVFIRVLSDRVDRLHEYVNIVGRLNLSYNTDREAYKGLIRAKSLHELFPAFEDVQQIFRVALSIGKDDAYLYQQRANYERIRPNGNLEDAERYLRVARELEPRNNAIIHTLAEVYRLKAEKSENKIIKTKYREQARSLIKSIMGRGRDDQYPKVTMVKMAIDDVKDLLNAHDSNDKEIDDAIREVERLLEQEVQYSAHKQYLLTLEADFSELLTNHPRSLAALERAFELNPRDPYIANRLSRAHIKQNNIEGAKKILSEALASNRGDLRLNYQYAETLRISGETDVDGIAYYYERSFTPGDRNYEAQFWFARYACESREEKKRNKSREVFSLLRSSSILHDEKVRIKDVAKKDGIYIVYNGEIERVEATYGYIKRQGDAERIFIHSNNVEKGLWKSLKRWDRVNYNIGYNYSGPAAINVELIR